MELTIPQTLLIDDDKSTNFFNKIIVEKHGAFDKVVAVNSGNRALEYFKAVENNLELKPNLVFLDINMPGMNGWEFLVELAKLEDMLIEDISIFMLSTSSDENDIKRSKQSKLVNGFFSKPLSFKLLDEILKKILSCNDLV